MDRHDGHQRMYWCYQCRLIECYQQLHWMCLGNHLQLQRLVLRLMSRGNIELVICSIAVIIPHLLRIKLYISHHCSVSNHKPY